MRISIFQMVVMSAGLGLAGVAGAAEGGDEEAPVEHPVGYDAGLVTPFTISAARPKTALILTDGGYDSARKTGIVDFAAEVHVWGPISIRGGGTYVSNGNTLKPTVGAIVHLWSGGGVDGSAGLFYKPEGLTEPEGEFEGLFALSYQTGRTTLMGNVVYGQDAEAAESDAEVRLGAVVQATKNVLVGADSRLRVAISSKAGTAEPDFDLVAGPVATLLVSDFALTAQVGGSVVKLGDTKAGVIALGGIARMF
jgi:hypothetical protein